MRIKWIGPCLRSMTTLLLVCILTACTESDNSIADYAVESDDSAVISTAEERVMDGITREDIKKGLATIEGIPTRDLDYIHLTNASGEMTIQQLQLEDSFMDFQITRLYHKQLFLENTWIDYLNQVRLEGEIVLSGELHYDRDFVEFIVDPSEKERVPAILYDFGQNGATRVLVSSDEILPSLVAAYGEYQGQQIVVENIEVQFRALHLTFSLNAPMSSAGGEVVRILDQDTSHIVYRSPGQE